MTSPVRLVVRWLSGCCCQPVCHYSWRGFTEQERDRAWDRLAGTILYGTAHDIAAARSYLLNGPPS